MPTESAHPSNSVPLEQCIPVPCLSWFDWQYTYLEYLCKHFMRTFLNLIMTNPSLPSVILPLIISKRLLWLAHKDASCIAATNVALWCEFFSLPMHPEGFPCVLTIASSKERSHHPSVLVSPISPWFPSCSVPNAKNFLLRFILWHCWQHGLLFLTKKWFEDGIKLFLRQLVVVERMQPTGISMNILILEFRINNLNVLKYEVWLHPLPSIFQG